MKNGHSHIKPDTEGDAEADTDEEGDVESGAARAGAAVTLSTAGHSSAQLPTPGARLLVVQRLGGPIVDLFQFTVIHR